MTQRRRIHPETFEKCPILFKVKTGEDSNPPDHHRDSQEYLVVFRGLEFEPNAACPASLSRAVLRGALATAEDWAKGSVFQMSQ